MKIIQVPFCFYPDPVGGTEIYVEALSQQLQTEEIQAVIAAPGAQNDSYTHQHLPVRRFAVTETTQDVGDLYAEGDVCAARAFGDILDQERPDVVHLHAFTPAVSLRLVRETKKRAVPVVFTYHTPTVSCQRGTLLRWGQEVCDGMLDMDLCTRCTLHGLGLPRAVADVTGRTPVAVGNLLRRMHLSGGAWTALRMRQLVHMRHRILRTFMGEVDHIVAVCQWVEELLTRNGVSPEKITVSRHGLAFQREEKVPGTWNRSLKGPSKSQVPIRIVFFGRLHPTKGVDVLVEAIRCEPDLLMSLDIYGVIQGASDEAYLESVRRIAGSDPRIRFRPAIPAGGVVSCLRDYDFLAVPSQCLETGPLVVLEAFAAGLPVLGSRLGGIAELVQDGIDGILVESASVQAWAEMLRRISGDKRLRMQLRAGVRPPRTMDGVAQEMSALYKSLRTHR